MISRNVISHDSLVICICHKLEIKNMTKFVRAKILIGSDTNRLWFGQDMIRNKMQSNFDL